MFLQRGSKFLTLISFLFIASYELIAQAGTYYDLISTSNPNFINDLKTRIRDPYTQVFYSQFDETNIANFASIDNGDGTRSVFCVYSNFEHVYSGTFSFLPINREHTYAHSWQPTHPSESGPEYSDQYHLFPTHETANSNRGNLPFGNVVVPDPLLTYGESFGGTDSNGDLVFEPRDAQKGDAARALFYMVVKYDGIDGNSWTFDWLNGTKLPALGIDPQNVATLINWHKQDPPDKWEVDRNNYIQSIQQNRNPFVDHPEWVDYINFNNLTAYSPVFAVEPQNHVTDFSASVLSNSITVNWADAAAGTQAPSGYLLMAYNKNNYFVPVDGSTYINDTDLSDGVALVNIPYSDPDSYLFNSLPVNSTYYFTIYSYNGTGAQINYNISGTITQTNALVPGVFAAEPTNHVTDFATGTITSNSIQLTWADAAAGTQVPEGYLILANTSGTFTSPTDGITYSDDSNLADGSGRANILYSASDSYTFSGLNSGTPYYFKIYSYNGSGTERNYKTDGTVPSTDGTTLSGGGSLLAGDIAIVGFNMDNPDEFAFVPLVDLPSGTQIKFTDNGWTAAGAFRANEGIVTFTASALIPKGTVKVFNSDSPSSEFVKSGSFDFSTSGDQLLAYTGIEATPYFLYAVNSEANGWQSDATTSNTSALPTGLINGSTAVALDEIDNAIYNGPINLLPADFLLSVSNKSNWTGSDATRQTMPSGVFPLPVELTTFLAKVVNSKVLLSWETETEVSNYGFAVERKAIQTASWMNIGFINGAGNSNSNKKYEFIDFDLQPGKYSYRLKQIDIDGSYTYSFEINVEIIPPVAHTLNQNYPNPFNPSTKISWESPVSSRQTLKVYDVLGNEVAILVDEYKPAGNYEVEFSTKGGSASGGDASHLSSGIYFYRLQSGNYVETKKMILLR